MIEIPVHPRYDEWSINSYGPDCFPCVVCGKAIKNKNVKFRVYMANSGMDLLSIEEAESDPSEWEELGMHPIGPDCVRQHPELQGYVVEVAEGSPMSIPETGDKLARKLSEENALYFAGLPEEAQTRYIKALKEKQKDNE